MFFLLNDFHWNSRENKRVMKSSFLLISHNIMKKDSVVRWSVIGLRSFQVSTSNYKDLLAIICSRKLVLVLMI